MHERTNPRARDVAPSTRLLSVFRDSTHDMGGTRDKPTPLGGRGWFSHTYGSKNHHRVPGGGAAGSVGSFGASDSSFHDARGGDGRPRRRRRRDGVVDVVVADVVVVGRRESRRCVDLGVEWDG